MGTYRLAEEAELDLVGIYKYGVERFGMIKADAFFFDLIKHFDKIAERPLSYPVIPGLLGERRRSVFRAISIYFRIQDSKVEISALLGRQDRNLRN